jgi:tRNA 2-selenouridine synthase SelU
MISKWREDLTTATNHTQAPFAHNTNNTYNGKDLTVGIATGRLGLSLTSVHCRTIFLIVATNCDEMKNIEALQNVIEKLVFSSYASYEDCGTNFEIVHAKKCFRNHPVKRPWKVHVKMTSVV